MHGSRKSSRCAAAVAAAVAMLSLVDCAGGPGATPPDRGREMISVLAAARPHPSLVDEARLWDRFIGAWDVDFRFFLEDGSVRESAGELTFGWVIDGRAIQDVWISYPQDSTKERNIGTSIRFFDPKARTWRVVFVSPAFSAIVLVDGGAEGDGIVLRGTDSDGAALRWSFNDIQAGSFVWRGEKSRDGGRTWRLEEEHHMKRRTGAR